MASNIVSPNALRKIVHVDMDSFFASCEQRDDPNLKGRPVVVGGAEERGVVAAASYEARKFGIHSAMPTRRALKLCPDLIVVRPRFDVYRAVSHQIREIFSRYTDIIEPLSLDEAYLDVTSNKMGLLTATKVAIQIKKDIKETTHLTASAGVSVNKFLAKLASDINKPDGLYVITPDMAESFVDDLQIGKFHGIGPATEEKMNSMGVFFGRDLKTKSLELLQQRFGKSGTYFYWIARGIDDRPVNPNRIRKSIGAENTFSSDLKLYEDMEAELFPLVEKVWRHSERLDMRGKTITLKVKYADFKQITRSHSLNHEFTDEEEILTISRELLKAVLPTSNGIRLLGVTLSGFNHKPSDEKNTQLSLF